MDTFDERWSAAIAAEYIDGMHFTDLICEVDAMLRTEVLVRDGEVNGLWRRAAPEAARGGRGRDDDEGLRGPLEPGCTVEVEVNDEDGALAHIMVL